MGVAILKAHEAILIDELSPLGVKPSHKLMSSHVHKVMQVQTVNIVLVLLLLCSLF